NGTIRITATITYAEEVLAPILIDFHNQHPTVHVELHASNEAINIDEQGFHMGFRILSRKGKIPGHFIAEKIGSVERHIFSHNNYLQATSIPRQPKDLDRHKLIPYGADRSFEPWRFQDYHGSEPSFKQTSLTFNSNDMIASAIEAGVGIGVLPSFYSRNRFKSTGVIRILSSFALIPDEIYIIYPQRMRKHLLLRSLVKYVRNRLAHDV
ncbi:MAG: hypothetical protein HRU19_30055, partial [Pseudobacteriovorax sp.]|nr:hypothetical protein [Pseudobacteriovorax sp.]